MSMIRVENLTFAYPSSYDNIFENVNFQIDTDWKLGFVGRNGRGKTTFLNLLLGKYEYHGKIQASVQFDYFPYPVNNKNRLTTDILSEVCLILSILVDTFFSKISLTMLLTPKPHNTVFVLS